MPEHTLEQDEHPPAGSVRKIPSDLRALVVVGDPDVIDQAPPSR
jgi:hypothetical protein